MKRNGKNKPHKPQASGRKQTVHEVPAELREELLSAVTEDQKLVLHIEGAAKKEESDVLAAPITIEGAEEVRPGQIEPLTVAGVAAAAQDEEDDTFIRRLHDLLEEEQPKQAETKLELSRDAFLPADGSPDPAPLTGDAEEEPAEELPAAENAAEEAPIEEEPAEEIPAAEEPAAEPGEVPAEEIPASEEPEDAAPEAVSEAAQSAEETNAEPEPAQTAVTYASVADAVSRAISAEDRQEGGAVRGPVDDETLLAELYALIGGSDSAAQPSEPEQPGAAPEPVPAPQPIEASEEEAPAEPVRAAIPTPAPIEPEQPKEEAPQPDEYEDEPIEVEELHGAPGWLKGAFLLLLSLLLTGMTLYAVASDVLGKLF